MRSTTVPKKRQQLFRNRVWAANKRREISKFKFKFPRARTYELISARSRLAGSQILQVNARWKALAEIYTMHSFAPFWNRIPKNRSRGIRFSWNPSGRSRGIRLGEKIYENKHSLSSILIFKIAKKNCQLFAIFC